MNRNFNKIYQEIYTNGIEELTRLRTYRNISLLAFLILLAFTTILYTKYMNWILMAVCILLTIVALVFSVKSSLDYKKGFKNLVIKRIVYLYDPEFRFYAERGISNSEYRNSFFDGVYDKFYSEDLIEGFIQEKYSFKMSQVKTIREEITIDSNGNREVDTHTLFYGLFGVVNIEDHMLMKMDITSNNFLNKYNKKRIEVDSGEFEKKYDMFSTDKVRAMEIFTSEIIEEFNKFHEDTGYVIQIKVDLDKLYFRISCGDAFEAPNLKDALSYEYLYKNFRMIDFPINIISKMLKNAIETRR